MVFLAGKSPNMRSYMVYIWFWPTLGLLCDLNAYRCYYQQNLQPSFSFCPEPKEPTIFAVRVCCALSAERACQLV
jgi:hypothetical protein